MVKRSVALLIVMLVLAAFVAACVAPPAPPPPAEQPPAAEAPAEEKAAPAAEPVVIGVLTPLSPPGDVAAGQLIQRGAELGVVYVNEVMGGVLGGRPIEIVIEDDQGTPEAGVAGYRRLAIQKGAVAVIGQFHSSVNLAVNEVAKEIGVPVFSTQSSARDITAKHYDIAFRTHAIDPARAAAWLTFIEENGFKRVALLAEDTDYGTGLIEETKRQAEERGMDIELNPIVFSRGTVDLTPQLLKVKAWNPDLVINIGVGEGAHLIIDQAYTIDLFPEVPMLASYDFPIRPEFWELHADDGAGLYFISYFHPQQELTDIGEWFTEQYEQKYDEPPVYTAYNAFGQIVILAQALNDAGEADPAALIKALEAGEFKSWSGTVTFPRGEGPFWHQWTPPLLILHYTEPNQSFRDAELVFQYKGE